MKLKSWPVRERREHTNAPAIDLNLKMAHKLSRGVKLEWK